MVVDVGAGARELAPDVPGQLPPEAAGVVARALAPRVPPASGAWREGDPVGRRRFADVGDLPLQLGGVLPQVRLAYETWGTLDADASNAVLVEHALTGDAHVSGGAGPGHPSPGWWSALVGPGRAVDTDRWFVVAANVVGGCQGSTGPASTRPGTGRPWGSAFPRITVADQVAAEARLADVLGIPRFAAVLGGSMGGMRSLEWAAAQPDRVGAALVLATTAASGADQIGAQSAQLTAILSDPGWHGGDYHDRPDGQGPHTGLGLARRLAHLSYRSAAELDARFGRAAQLGEDPLSPTAPGRYAVQSYLDHHADKLVRRFDAGSYVALTDALNTWDVGLGRGGTEAALAAVAVPMVVAAVDSDRLYPVADSQRIVDAAPAAVGGLRVVTSTAGHDGFLLEAEQIAPLVTEVLELGSR
ncbi:homoserine O-acetyltransferase [Kineococcus radiotolerans]|uniref:Homoserine O-acetyltransferase n=1 Tax=Kineococcus radiotolerans TaxID=131568 RepID=A0A7W4TKZ4_KINRA|nr:homoserine O-acetyltransferase [Kineococcus radiotolerans]MBB2900847.1 homoserine O-acetyltransferase [Kineococcus radiotolerans]